MELKPVGEMRQPQYPQREQMRDNSHLLLERIPHGWRRFGENSRFAGGGEYYGLWKR